MKTWKQTDLFKPTHTSEQAPLDGGAKLSSAKKAFPSLSLESALYKAEAGQQSVFWMRLLLARFLKQNTPQSSENFLEILFHEMHLKKGETPSDLAIMDCLTLLERG